MSYEIGTKVFEDWEIVREIGHGAYGHVYEIQKTEFGVTAKSAMKIVCIPPSEKEVQEAFSEGMDEASVSQYFRGFMDDLVREIAVMTDLSGHPNIVGYQDHHVVEHDGEIGWDIQIRMELLESLVKYLLRVKTVPEEKIIQLGINISNALMTCDEKGIIHRDVKPDNIFVDAIGNFKLGDFGVARAMEKTTGGLSKKGTESYMAPEVYFGRPYGKTVDIYSLGLVLYRLANRSRLPFYPLDSKMIKYTDREEALSKRMNGTPLPPPCEASPEFAEVILKACEADPKDRYRSAEELKTALENLKYQKKDRKNEEKDAQKVSSDQDHLHQNWSDREPAEETMGVFGGLSEETVGVNEEKEKSGVLPDQDRQLRKSSDGEPSKKTTGVKDDHAEETVGVYDSHREDNIGEYDGDSDRTVGVYERHNEETVGVFGDRDKKEQEEKERLEREAREKKKREDDEREARVTAAAAGIVSSTPGSTPAKKSSGPLKPILILLVICGIGYMIFKSTGGQLPGSGQNKSKETMTANNTSSTSDSQRISTETKETEAKTENETQARTEKETQARTEKETQQKIQEEANQKYLSNPGVVYEVQTALNAAGYDCGTPDGIAGRRTNSAVQAYKKANGLEDDSEITHRLLQLLGVHLTKKEMIMHKINLKADMANFWFNNRSDNSKTDFSAFFTNKEETHGGFIIYYSDEKGARFEMLEGSITVVNKADETTLKLIDESGMSRPEIRELSYSNNGNSIHLSIPSSEIDEELPVNSNDDIKNYVVQVMTSWWEFENG